MKKYLILIILMASSIDLLSQEKLDSIFMELNTNDMHSNYLWDKQFKWVDPLNFQGDISQDSLANLEGLLQLSHQFSYSNMTGTSNFKNTEQLDSIYSIRKFKDSIPISLLFAEYDKLADDALQRGAVYFASEQLFDSVGRSWNPYNLQHCFLAAIDRDTIYVESYSDSLEFIIPEEFIHSDPELDSIFINFRTGNGNQRIYPNTSMVCNFDSVGTNSIVLTVFRNGDEYQSEIEFTVILNYNPPVVQSSSYPADFSFSIINPISGKPGAYAHIWFACPESNTIKRPFIIVEGFDALNENNDEDYAELLYENADDFHKKLLYNNYDVILLDFEEGGGDIPDNARNLEALLDILNTQSSINGCSIDLASDISVMGISMGGIVSRYCLSDMQSRNKPHNVGLWFTVDSPHQGAYIPWAIRQFAYFNYKIMKKWVPGSAFEEIRDSYNTVKSPAAKQMLISDASLNTTLGSYDNSNEFNALYNNLRSLPFPDVQRTFAVTNGSLTGINQHSGYNSEMEYYRHNSLVDFFFGRYYNDLTYRSISDVNYYPNQRITYSFHEQIVKIGVFGFYIKIGGDDKSFSAYPHECSYEIIPGGFRKSIEQIRDGMSTFNKLGVFTGTNHIYYAQHAFIPTASSLDIRNPDGSVPSRALWKTNLKDLFNNGSIITPFQKIYGLDNYNTPHALAMPITDQTIKGQMYSLLNNIFDNEIAPINLYMQNETIVSGKKSWIEAVQKVYCGREVTTEKPIGDFVIQNGAEVNIRAGQEIIFKPGTHLQTGSYVHAKIDDVFDGCINPPASKSVVSGLSQTNESYQDRNSYRSSVSINPNPFINDVNIEINIANQMPITLSIFDILGNKIASLADNISLSQGSHTYTFSGSAHSSGIYYVVLSTPQERISKPIVLAK